MSMDFQNNSDYDYIKEKKNNDDLKNKIDVFESNIKNNIAINKDEYDIILKNYNKSLKRLKTIIRNLNKFKLDNLKKKKLNKKKYNKKGKNIINKEYIKNLKRYNLDSKSRFCDKKFIINNYDKNYNMNIIVK